MKGFFKVIFSFLYKLLASLNLQPALFIALVGVVLYFTGVMQNAPAVLVIFQILLIFSAIYAIVATVRKLLGIDKKIKKSKGMQIVDGEEREDGQRQNNFKQADKAQPVINNDSATADKESPRYYKVKQNPDYVMAEYDNRYELFLITNEGLKKIRTDYKE